MTDDRWQLFKSEKGGKKYLYIKLIIYILSSYSFTRLFWAI